MFSLTYFSDFEMLGEVLNSRVSKLVVQKLGFIPSLLLISNMKKIFSVQVLFLLLIIFILIEGVYSLPDTGIVYDAFYVSVDIEENMVFISQDVFFNAISQQISLQATLAKGAENINVYIDDKRADYVIDNSSNIVINSHQPLLGKHFMHIDYTSSHPLSRMGERLLFRYDAYPVEITKGFTLLIKLPLGHGIPFEINKSDSYFVTPEADRIYSDGRRTSIVWLRTEVSEKFSVSVISEEKNKEGRVPIYAATLAIAIIGTGIFVLYMRIYVKRKRVPETDDTPFEENIAVPDLIESEMVVVDILRSSTGRMMKQRDIQEKSGFSKAKLSRVLRNLEERRVILKKPSGNTNEITLVSDR